MTTLAPLLEAFFLDRLLRQQRASPNTIASYRDTFRLLLAFAEQRLRKAPSSLLLSDIDAPFLGSFLNYLALIRQFFELEMLFDIEKGLSLWLKEGAKQSTNHERKATENEDKKHRFGGPCQGQTFAGLRRDQSDVLCRIGVVQPVFGLHAFQ
jgi:hypothetical protein